VCTLVCKFVRVCVCVCVCERVFARLPAVLQDCAPAVCVREREREGRREEEWEMERT